MKHLHQPWPVRSGRTVWVAAALVVIAIIGLLSLVDATISHWGRSLPAAVIEVFAEITRFGESDYVLIPSFVLWAVSALLALVIPKTVPRLALRQMAGIWAFVFVGVGLPSLVTTILKRIVGRGRPDLFDQVGTLSFEPGAWIDWTYQSFPSGHATTAFAVCFVLSFLSPRWYPGMLVFAAAVSLSRIVVGAHYPTDLIGGAVIGIIGAYAVRNFFGARGWVFERRPDGAYVMRPLGAVHRLVASFRKRREASRPRP